MLNFFPSFSKPPEFRSLPLKPYLVDFSLDRLFFGVDNVHFDVHISPHLYNALENTASLIMIKHSRSETYYKDYKRETCESEKSNLKHLCRDILQDGINRAKIEGEHQIDFLAQAALSKMFLEEVKNQYRNLVAFFEQQVSLHQLSPRHADYEEFKAREKLSEIKWNQNRIIRLAGEELFSLLTDIQTRSLRALRETHFHAGQILPDIFFNNPVLHTNNPADDFFLIEEYILLGKRSRDPDSYDNVRTLIYDLLASTDPDRQDRTVTGMDKDSNGSNICDPWIMEAGNIDLMFNYFDSRELCERAKRSGSSDDRILELQKRIKNQQSLFNLFYRAFAKAGLLKPIVSAVEVKSVCGIYCPPMKPRQIREFL
ncbi:MAG TPA: hypothetical protein VKO67_08515, partial [Smithellaceae bacterium]|nr:hypothetical protein [Smithellaceae bacterium]